MLVVHLFIVVIILQCRKPVAAFISAPANRTGFAARLRNRAAGLWHYLAIALDLALWAVWALNIRNGYSLLLQYFVGTIAVVLVTRLAIVVALSLIDRGFRIKPEIRAAANKEPPPDPAPFDVGLLPRDEYIVTDGEYAGQRGFFTRDASGAVTGVDLAGRLATRVEQG